MMEKNNLIILSALNLEIFNNKIYPFSVHPNSLGEITTPDSGI